MFRKRVEPAPLVSIHATECVAEFCIRDDQDRAWDGESFSNRARHYPSFFEAVKGSRRALARAVQEKKQLPAIRR